jgi:hypothetical protein
VASPPDARFELHFALSNLPHYSKSRIFPCCTIPSIMLTLCASCQKPLQSACHHRCALDNDTGHDGYGRVVKRRGSSSPLSNAGDSEHETDKHNSSNSGTSSSHYKTPSETSPRRHEFACPFSKAYPKNPDLSRTCMGRGWSNIHRLK